MFFKDLFRKTREADVHSPLSRGEKRGEREKTLNKGLFLCQFHSDKKRECALMMFLLLFKYVFVLCWLSGGRKIFHNSKMQQPIDNL